MGGGWCIFFSIETRMPSKLLSLVVSSMETKTRTLQSWKGEIGGGKCVILLGDDGEDGLEGGKKQGEKSETKANGKGLSVCFSLG
jgi:hypothetical protein